MQVRTCLVVYVFIYRYPYSTACSDCVYVIMGGTVAGDDDNYYTIIDMYLLKRSYLTLSARRIEQQYCSVCVVVA